MESGHKKTQSDENNETRSGSIRSDQKIQLGCYKKKKNLKHTRHTHKSQFPFPQYTFTYPNTHNPPQFPISLHKTHTVTPNGVRPTPSRQQRPPRKSMPDLLHIRRSTATRPSICCCASMAADLLQVPSICYKCRRFAARCYRSAFCCSKPSTQATRPEFLPFGS